MRSLAITRSLVFSSLSACLAVSTTTAQQTPATPAAWVATETALGRKGGMQPGDVFKVSFPRTDLRVSVGGVRLKPAFALGGWVAFKQVANGMAMVMGDFALTENEVAPVMRALQAGGVEPTALHNHLLGESPRILYVHIAGQGEPSAMARAIHDALAQSKTPLGPPSPPIAPSAADLDTAGIAAALGAAGQLNGSVYQVSIPRREQITEMGRVIPPSMGVATAINFQPTGGGKAAITGDFAMRASEVRFVIRTLRAHGIVVNALHSHMLDEEPRLFFAHFWADADAVTLAKGLRAALDETKSGK